jgi:hypothetical protein
LRDITSSFEHIISEQLHNPASHIYIIRPHKPGMTPNADRSRPIRAANLGSINYSNPHSIGIASNPSWNHGVQDHAQADGVSTKQSLKRKAGEKTKAKNKKQKTQTQAKQVTDEDFRTAETQHYGMVQPIGITMSQIPLRNVEIWRMRGWRWQEAFKRTESEKHSAEAKSPMGSNFLWT